MNFTCFNVMIKTCDMRKYLWKKNYKFSYNNLHWISHYNCLQLLPGNFGNYLKQLYNSHLVAVFQTHIYNEKKRINLQIDCEIIGNNLIPTYLLSNL